MSSDENRTRKDVLIAITPRILKVLDRPDPSIESFASGTADSFGPPAPAVPVTPAPAPAPRPGTPGTTPGRP
jgi:hypothetical protein